MKTSKKSLLARSSAVRLGGLASAGALLLVMTVHCYVSVSEGDRCNIALSHDECDNAPTLQCMVPPGCVVAYCCGPSSTSPNCQACPSGDAGPEDGGDDGSTGDAGAGDTGVDATDGGRDAGTVDAADAGSGDAADAGGVDAADAGSVDAAADGGVGDAEAGPG